MPQWICPSRWGQCIMKARGFSLIELVIVIMLIAVIGSAAGIMIEKAANAALTQAAKTDQDWQLRVAMERMVRDLSRMDLVANLSVIQEDEIIFRTIRGETVRYAFDNENSQILRGNTHALADNISNLEFYYYDINGNEVPPGGNATLVRYILIRIVSNSNNTETSVESLVFPKQF